jgi:adenosylhomocysteine nucleosidase
LLAFIAAEAREFAGVLQHAGHVARLDWPLDFARSARLNDRDVVLIANGPGPKLAAQAAQTAKEHVDLEGLVSIGFCGGLNPTLKPADLFVADQLVEPNLAEVGGPAVAHALSVPRSHSCERPAGKLLSLDHVATTASEKHKLHASTHADAIEMEAAAVAAKARAWQIPFYAIKAVTDTASESFPLDFNRLRTPEGRFSLPKIIFAAFGRPNAFPALLRLNRRCTLAAQALGDFLADARF